MHSAWLTRCYPSKNYSSPAIHFTGMKSSSKPSNSRNSPSSTKSTTESKSWTRPSPRAWPRTGRNKGIGYWLFQKHCSCPSNDLFCCKQGWKITLVGSSFTHAAVSIYAPIEREALAVADALDKARHFVLGCKNLTVAVDHQPLLKIFGDRSLNNISNTRLRNLKEKTLRYRFKMVHIPGIKNKAPDTLSRHPTGDTQPPKMSSVTMYTTSETAPPFCLPQSPPTS